jgi:hypothetical protein
MATAISNNRVLVVCSSGIEVIVKPISLRLLERFDLEHQEPKAPMIEVEAIGGVEEMVEDEEDPEYLEQMEEYSSETINDLLNLLVDFAIDIELPEGNHWLKKLNRAGIEVTDDEDDKIHAYVNYIVMEDTLGDLKKIISQSFMLSGVSEEAISSWMDLF